MNKTLDVSVYDWSTFDAECFKANGVERLIVGSSNYGVSSLMIRRAREAGIIVEDLYGFIYYGLGYESRDLDNCIRLAQELDGIQRIWLDCESGFSDDGADNDTEAPGITVQYRQMRTREQRFRVETNGLDCGIYTGAFWWPSKMGNTTEFSGLPLWLANYGTNDPNNPRDPITEVNFGGWTKVAAHQYSSTIGLCGRSNRDHNYWFLEDEMELSKEAMVALFGSTERDANGNLLSVEERYGPAKDRYDEAIATGRSLLEQVGQASAALKAHDTNHGGAGGGIPKHTHEIAAAVVGDPK